MRIWGCSSYSFSFHQLGDSCVRSAFQNKPTTLLPPKPEVTTVRKEVETNLIQASDTKPNYKRRPGGPHRRKNPFRKETSTRRTNASRTTTVCNYYMFVLVVDLFCLQTTTSTTPLSIVTTLPSQTTTLEPSSAPTVASTTTTIPSTTTSTTGIFYLNIILKKHTLIIWFM